MRQRYILTVLILTFCSSVIAGSSAIAFSENRGQWNSKALFRSALPNGQLYLEQNDFLFVIYAAGDLAKMAHPAMQQKGVIHGCAFKEEFIGANKNALASGVKALPTYENYFLGKDRKHWASHVGVFEQLTYKQLYNNIDLLMYCGANGQLEYDFTVKPGASTSQIQVLYKGVENVQLQNGSLMIKTAVAVMEEQHPYAYQQINGVQTEVKCNFVLKENVVGFEFPEGYNKKYSLVIDPVIVFSTYTGTGADNWGYTATYDTAGNMFLGGLVQAGVNPYGDTTSFDPTLGAFQTTWGGGNALDGIQYACDMGISKFSADGSRLIYRTYIGGSDNETPHSLIVDAHGNLVIYGVSYSSDFPVTQNAYDTTYNGAGDIVVVILDSTGGALVGSTYIGGTGTDGINFDPGENNAGNLKKNYGDQNRGEVNLDANGNIYVASCTMSSNFPVTPGVVQNIFGGTQDGCVFKLSPDCSQLLWSTFLGGSSDDACYAVTPGAGGSVFVAGGTMSNNFPIVGGGLGAGYHGGSYDGFVARINATGTAILSSSYIGTTGNDQVYLLTLDKDSNIYFMGQTTGAYPVYNATYSNANSGQFIEKVNTALDSVFYSTVFGNGTDSANISPTALMVDTAQNVYVAGWGTSGSSTDFDLNIFESLSPVYINNMYNMLLTPNAFQSTTDGTDFYFFVLKKDAQDILFGSYFGGSGYPDHVDGGTNRFDPKGIIYEAICGGCLNGNSLTPTTVGAWSRTNDSWNCNEMGLKIAFDLNCPAAVQTDTFATICFGDTLIYNGGAYATAGIYNNYFRSKSRCDSIVNLHLQVNGGVTNSNAVICPGDSIYFGHRFIKQSGNYVDTVQSVAGCDSIINLLVGLNYPLYTYINEPFTICAGGVFTMGANHYIQAGNYGDTLQAVQNGCDSIVFFSLDVLPPVTSSISESICSGGSYTLGSHSHTQQGTYNDTIQSIGGCDSVIRLYLTVLPVPTSHPSAGICPGGSYQVGNIAHSQPGFYSDTIQTLGGCDSVVNLTLTVDTFSLIVKPSVSDQSLYISSYLSFNTSIEWVDCSTQQVAAIGTGISFTPSTSGAYAAIVQQNGCYDTSLCVPIISTSIAAVGSEGIRLWPNPANRTVNVLVPQQLVHGIRLLDITGKLLQQLSGITNPLYTFDVSMLSDGVYVVEITGDDWVINQKLVKVGY